MTTQMQYIGELSNRYDVLADARRALAEAEASLLRSKARLTEADRALDELMLMLVATAPKETCTNEAQRKAYALDGSRAAAEVADGLRAAHLEEEIRHLYARHYVRQADDARRFLEMLPVVAALPGELYLPETAE